MGCPLLNPSTLLIKMKNIQNKADRQNTPSEKKWGEELGKRIVIRSTVTVERRAL